MMGYINAKIKTYGDNPLCKLIIKTNIGNHSFLMYKGEVAALARSIPKYILKEAGVIKKK